jgi:serine/threonine-protein kinase RsbT
MEMEFVIKGGDFAAAGEAASKVKNILRQVGVDSSLLRRTAIVAYEAEMNIVIHARSGILRFQLTPDHIVIIAEDEGPGMADIDLAMQEGFSTAPEEIREMGFGAGMGLPNIKRCSDEFFIESQVGEGTYVKVVIHNPERKAVEA